MNEFSKTQILTWNLFLMKFQFFETKDFYCSGHKNYWQVEKSKIIWKYMKSINGMGSNSLEFKGKIIKI